MTDPRDDGRSDAAAHPPGADEARAASDGAFRGVEPDARRLPPPAAPVAAVAAPPRRHGLRRFLGWWMVLALVCTACIVCLAIGFSVFDADPIHIVIDGDDVTGITIGSASLAVKAMVFVSLAAAMMLVLLLVPLVVLVVVGAVVFAIVAGFGTPIILMALALAALTSPLWIVGLVVWFFARRRRAHSATIAA
jgi:hypothetical protein